VFGAMFEHRGQTGLNAVWTPDPVGNHLAVLLLHLTHQGWKVTEKLPGLVRDLFTFSSEVITSSIM
jgi:hypothetical protein